MERAKLERYRSLLQERLALAAELAGEERAGTTAVRVSRRDRRLVENIRAALERIERGRYGLCDQCGRALSDRQLEWRPAATLCPDCRRPAGPAPARGA